MKEIEARTLEDLIERMGFDPTEEEWEHIRKELGDPPFGMFICEEEVVTIIFDPARRVFLATYWGTSDVEHVRGYISTVVSAAETFGMS